jgi:hypothetical protein
MFDQVAIDLPQIYHQSFTPITHYYQEHKNNSLGAIEIQKLLPYAKLTNSILVTFFEIIDDLSYDKDKFEQIIFSFDDDYDMLSEFVSKLDPSITSHKELLAISDNILSNLIKAQNELGLIISVNDHQRI